LVISNYGRGVVLKYIFIAVIIVIFTVAFAEGTAIRYSVFALVAVLSVFVISFFRDPERKTPNENNIVVSPADGKIVLVKDLFDSEYLQKDAVQVSIFMSPLNVHVNRFPVSGTVDYFKHIGGAHLVAFEDKSSELNERTHIGVENRGYRVLFKQIAGTVARRIVADIEIGQKVTAGERFGMIKFGSRVDVIMPKGTEVCVKSSDHVLAGETVIARYNPLMNS